MLPCCAVTGKLENRLGEGLEHRDPIEGTPHFHSVLKGFQKEMAACRLGSVILVEGSGRRPSNSWARCLQTPSPHDWCDYRLTRASP